MSTSSLRRVLTALIAGAAVMVGVLAGASAASASTLYACVKKNGSAHLYSKKPKCKKGESKLSWNNTGPAGKNGANGTNGTPGAAGKEGAAGKVGANGTAVAYAEVSSTGTLGGNSKGVIKLTPGKEAKEGIFCLDMENPTAIHVGVAGLNLFGGGSQPGFASVNLAPLIEVIFEDCTNETTLVVHTYNAKGETAPEGFFAIFD